MTLRSRITRLEHSRKRRLSLRQWLMALAMALCEGENANL